MRQSFAILTSRSLLYSFLIQSQPNCKATSNLFHFPFWIFILLQHCCVWPYLGGEYHTGSAYCVQQIIHASLIKRSSNVEAFQPSSFQGRTSFPSRVPDNDTLDYSAFTYSCKIHLVPPKPVSLFCCSWQTCIVDESHNVTAQRPWQQTLRTSVQVRCDVFDLLTCLSCGSLEAVQHCLALRCQGHLFSSDFMIIIFP